MGMGMVLKGDSGDESTGQFWCDGIALVGSQGDDLRIIKEEDACKGIEDGT